MNKHSSLNERDYGDLVGLNKLDTAKKYGEDQVKIWRRSFEIPPPPMDSQHPYKKEISSGMLSESLKDTFERVIPYYEKQIKPLISSKKNGVKIKNTVSHLQNANETGGTYSTPPLATIIFEAIKIG